MCKRKFIACLLAVCMAFSSVPAAVFGQSVEDYNFLSSTFNTEAVADGPNAHAQFEIPKNLRIDAITVYHWNGGNGAAPGTISLYDGDTERELYTWQAYGRNNNTYWDCFPDIYLGAGSYYVTDSDWKTAISA